MEGSNAKEVLSCAGCLNDIGDADYVSALSQDWHRECFRCSVCDAPLSTWYFEKGGLLFCQGDYWERYGDNCQQCTQVMTGPVMAAGEHRFHPECFACVQCGCPVEDGDSYALVDRSQLYCGSCYSECVRARRDSHAIRVLSLPGDAFRLAASRCGAVTVSHGRCAGKLSALAKALLRAAVSVCVQLTCHRIDSGCGVLTLHLGDRVLEVDGAPARPDVARAPPRPTLVQLTIEHIPETINTRRSHAHDAHAHVHAHAPTHDAHKHEIKSPVERKIIKEDKKYVPDEGGGGGCDEAVKRERFKRKGAAIGVRSSKRPPSALAKERSSSMSKLLDVASEGSGVQCDLSRARSFRAEPSPALKVFRASDLLQGELLGAGFFGEVYRVTHRDTGEVMVLKQLYRVDEDAQRNFLKEVAVLRSLKHPNVLRFVGVLYRDKRLHLVTEFVDGGTLHKLLQEHGRPLSWAVRSRLARDVAAGVGYLHRMSVIHRDLNSHNCLVRVRGGAEGGAGDGAGGGEELSVVVADFGLARIAQRATHATLRRKRYTVVGNPYWMAPEMMNGLVYGEKVDVFSFGIVLCEIIGRVSADPDYLPRRSDFGLNEAAFVDKFCRACPEPFYRIAFLACHLDPDMRPPFEVLEIWLESLVRQLRWGGGAGGGGGGGAGPLGALLADVLQYTHGARARGRGTPERPLLLKSSSSSALCARRGAALGKCVSAGQLAGRLARRAPGYILRARGHAIDITKVDDISEWLEPAPLKRSGPGGALAAADPPKLRRLDHLLRDSAAPASPAAPATPAASDTSDDSDEELCRVHVASEPSPRQPRPEPAAVPAPPEKPPERTTFFPRGLLSPKFKRLFGQQPAAEDKKPDEVKEKSKSKFFVQRPASPGARCAYRVRPAGPEAPAAAERAVLASDLKLARLGRPMTPVFRRHLPAERAAADVRFSCRERRCEPRQELARTKDKTKGLQRSPGNPLTPLVEKKLIEPPEKEEKGDKEVKRRELGITRSNYVRLANLRISKTELARPKDKRPGDSTPPLERVV